MKIKREEKKALGNMVSSLTYKGNWFWKQKLAT